MITELPPVIAGEGEPPTGLGADHPMRQITRAVAFEPDGWTPERRDQVIELFDGLAGEWNTRDVPGREAPLLDALHRGLDHAPELEHRVAIDIGAGTGLFVQELADRFPHLFAVDISGEMLRHAPAEPALRVQADASGLPVADGAVDAFVLVNCFLFPAEVDRVLAPHGAVVWVNSRGADTPIHLTADEVDRALPGAWSGVASTAGWGTWSVHWRAGGPAS
ncbi:MAG: methyltransferase domain-containing protein [Acidimicrobiales bacterium]